MRHQRRYKNESSHPIPVWNGILEHHEKIGPALWEFIWCLDKITKEPKDGTEIGWCLGRAPIKAERVARDLNESVTTAQDNLLRLEREGYIVRVRTSFGYSMGVKNSRKFDAFRRSSFPMESEKTPSHDDSEKTHSHIAAAPEEKLVEKAVERRSEFSGSRSFPDPDSEKRPITKKTRQKTRQSCSDRFFQVLKILSLDTAEKASSIEILSAWKILNYETKPDTYPEFDDALGRYCASDQVKAFHWWTDAFVPFIDACRSVKFKIPPQFFGQDGYVGGLRDVKTFEMAAALQEARGTPL